MDTKELRVGSGTPAKALAGSILSCIEDSFIPVLISIGPISLNQAVKAFIIAKGKAYTKGVELSLDHDFTNLTTDRGTVVAIRSTVRCHSVSR